MPAWFDYIDRHRQRESGRVEVSFHPETGYPARIHVDRHTMISDDEVTWHLGELEALPDA
jgi:hypothetical protein